MKDNWFKFSNRNNKRTNNLIMVFVKIGNNGKIELIPHLLIQWKKIKLVLQNNQAHLLHIWQLQNL